MKKTLLALAIATVAVQAAAQQVENFSWTGATLTGVTTAQATVNGFNSANGVLNSITLAITGTSVSGSLIVTNLTGPQITSGADLIGTHILSLGGHTTPLVGTIGPLNSGINVSAFPQFIDPGLSATFNMLQLLGANTTGALVPGTPADFTGGTVNVLVRLAGGISLNGDLGNNLISQRSTILNTVVGTVTYNFTPRTNQVPEAETYVAGLALAGLAGYGFYRRNKLA